VPRMTVPSGARLHAQLHCLSTDGTVVITVQHWRDPAAPKDHPRGWIRLVRNGRRREDRRYGGADGQRELESAWAELAARYAPTRLDEERMWAKLRELAGVEPVWCQGADCSIALPVAWWICPTCGRDARRVAGGAMLTARGRGVIVLRTGARKH